MAAPGPGPEAAVGTRLSTVGTGAAGRKGEAHIRSLSGQELSHILGEKRASVTLTVITYTNKRQ